MTAHGEWKEMFRAAREGDVELVRHHLGQGVDVDHSHPEMQSTALVEACLAGHRDVAHLLLDHGADPHLPSVIEECTPVEAARRGGLDDVVLRLRSLGAQEPAPVVVQRRGLAGALGRLRRRAVGRVARPR